MAEIDPAKAFLIDMDDTLTRVPDVHTYHRATYDAYCDLATDAPMPFEVFGLLHGAMYDSGQCHFTGFGERFALQPLTLFRTHHDKMPFGMLVFDEASASALQSLADRALLLTDGAQAWAERCLARLGVTLEVQARDNGDYLQPIKAGGDERWQAALQRLSQKTRMTLASAEVLMIDDSARVLRHARMLGFQTAQIHFGNPERQYTGEFMKPTRLPRCCSS